MERILLVAALLPVFLIMWYIYRQDRNPEPTNVLAATFGFGCLSVVPAIALEMIPVSGPLLEVYLIVAPAEELVKLAVIMLYIWRHKDFDDAYDAIVYCVMASLGFAAVENILYVFDSGLQVALMRAIFSVPGHAAFAIFMGFFVAKAKNHHFYSRRKKMVGALLAAFVVPVFVHGTYDYLLTDPSYFYIWLVFVVFMDVTAFLMVRHVSKNDRPLVSDNF